MVKSMNFFFVRKRRVDQYHTQQSENVGLIVRIVSANVRSELLTDEHGLNSRFSLRTRTHRRLIFSLLQK